MIYNTGTISINGNTATGTGTNWTAAASQIRVSQTIIVLSNPVQMFQITAINSGTSLTVTPAASPALSGQKYGILVTDSLSVDGLAQSMSQLINEYDENIGAWETFASTSANQLVTVTINGTSLSIPAIGGLARKGANSDITELKGLTTALSIGQGGTGAKTKEDARTNLGLGYGNTTGTVAQGNDERLSTLHGKTGGTILSPITIATGAGFNDKHTLKREDGEAAWVAFIANGVIRWRIGMSTSGDSDRFKIAGWTSGGGSYVNSLNIAQGSIVYTTENTTKASDGTLKAASPVARIVKNQEECQRTDIDEQGFAWCGCGTANAEAEGISLSRLDVGVYALTGSSGLATEGWQLLPPMDPCGMGELGVVEAEQTDDGLTICLYKRKYILSDDGEIIKTKGEPIDVPLNSWIDVRLDMPEDSIFKRKVN